MLESILILIFINFTFSLEHFFGEHFCKHVKCLYVDWKYDSNMREKKYQY